MIALSTLTSAASGPSLKHAPASLPRAPASRGEDLDKYKDAGPCHWLSVRLSWIRRLLHKVGDPRFETRDFLFSPVS